MLDFNILFGILVAVGIVIFIRFGMPYLKNKGYDDIYADVKMGLLLFGYAFRDEKVKAIANLILSIVKEVEELSITAKDKQAEAVNLAFRALIKELNIEIDEEAVKTIINIAVSYLPPTQGI